MSISNTAISIRTRRVPGYFGGTGTDSYGGRDINACLSVTFQLLGGDQEKLCGVLS